MHGVSGDLLLSGCGVGDVLLYYPLPRDIFVKGYGLLKDDKSNEEQSGSTPKKLQHKLLENGKSNEQFGSALKKPKLSLKLQCKSQPALSSDATNTLGTSRLAEPVTDEYSEKAAKGSK